MKFKVTEPKFVVAAGTLAQEYHDFLIDYAKSYASDMHDVFVKLSKKRRTKHVHVITDCTFDFVINDAKVTFAYDIYFGESGNDIRLIECFIRINSWSFLMLKISIVGDNNDDADGEEKPIQEPVSVHDGSLDKGV